MEKLTKTEIKWTVDALQLTIGYYEQVIRKYPHVNDGFKKFLEIS